ncbi:hypothetical protein [Thermostaphylospora chromogena]|uniref:Uncharacterized protein n=1 Tax=Thermostaphylospora chromogena TaxID=35622 RepID=A0A1H1HUP8_9ACTN|nr:hypothetical protein [Thermostaphylospora chromogena]SDR29133.1 hypothetical protein SAMN04489764_4843 [Thermostaphylospora chromogena]
MRLPPRVIVPVAAVVLVTGCGEVQELNNKVDQAQACLEATRVVTGINDKIVEMRNNPEQLSQILEDSAAKLQDAAEKAGDTTLREALEGLAGVYRNLDISDVNSAVDAAQKALADTAKYAAEITAACT